MNRSDITTILADIDETMTRVRDLSVSPSRAAALQSLDDARRHLTIALAHAHRASVPPGDNTATRERATEAFRSARRILGTVLKD